MLKKVQSLINQKKYLVRLHARERMLEREITFQEVRETLENSKIIEEYLDDRPFPSFLALGFTSNNRPLHTIWALKNETLVYLISVYEPDPEIWINFKERKK
ncbi:MAG: DUF4258 domain-containing protein [Candidatus Hodarchaeota archaeon]